MKNNFIIILAIIMHFLWGLCLILSPVAIHTTGIDIVLQAFPNHYIAGLIFSIIAGCSFLSILRNKIDWIGVLLLIPQQILLIISAGGALNNIFLGHFADGVVRSRYFIFADQLPAILITIFYTLAILQTYTNVFRNKTQWK